MTPGDWVVLRLPPDFVRRGQVVSIVGYSMVVQWQSSTEESVLPWAGYYIEEGWLTAVEAPRGVRPNGPREAAGLLEVAQVAAMLGITSKQVRSMLRSGKLTGRKENHRWSGVESQTAYAVLQSRSSQATD